MKLLKNKFMITGLILTVLVLLSFFVIFFISEYTLELSVNDGDVITIEYDNELTEPKVIAIYKGNIFKRKGIKVEVKKEGVIDMGEIGTYDVTYMASYKDKKVEASVKIIVQDKTPPVIELVSDENYYTSPVAQYKEEGFTAKDNYDGDITNNVVREEKDGIVIYTVTDSNGNVGKTERKIVYKDVVAPVITLNGNTDIVSDIGKEYLDAGFTAIDDCDGDITDKVKVEGSVNGFEFGEYSLNYKVMDSSGNECVITRNVKVEDISAPLINLNGDENVYIKKGEEYVDAGITAIDNVDGDVSLNVKLTGGVNTDVIGSYSITYEVGDKAGNIANISRHIYVYEKQMEVTEIYPGSKVVYLTFDDGPGVHTERLLNILDKFGVKATFFVTNQYPAYQNMIGEAYRRGHTVALHTYSHEYSIYSSEIDYYNDLKLIEDICVAQTGVKPTIVRFPGGTSNTISRNYCSGIMTALTKSLSYHGYLYSDWNVSSGDAGGTTSVAGVVSNVIRGIQGQDVSIVLQHDIKGFSVDAVEQIVAWGLANGYTFLPMTETTPMVHQTPGN